MIGLSYGQLSPRIPPDPGIFYGIRLGLLAHDIGGLWSNTRAAEGMDAGLADFRFWGILFAWLITAGIAAFPAA